MSAPRRVPTRFDRRLRNACELSEAWSPNDPHVLRDYSFIADGRRGALIGPDGNCAWLCFPSWDDPAVFAGLLGSGGTYAVLPEGRWVWGGYYEDGSLIWNSRWVGEDWIVESRDALAYPGEPDRAVLLRRITSMAGRSRLTILLEPSVDYGRRFLSGWKCPDGVWEAKEAGLTARWFGARDANLERGPSGRSRLALHLDLRKGDHRDLVLELSSDGVPLPSKIDAEHYWQSTEAAWHEAVPACSGVVAARDVRRSVAVLRGMTGPEGGTVAAATTSLPERAEQGRNYDYRYVWVRDTCYIGHAGARLVGGEQILDDSVRWITTRLLADGNRLMPAYTVRGDPIPDESALGLPGYPGGNDVVGNGVREQFQLDGFGEALLLLAAASSQGRLDVQGWRAAEAAARAIEQRWREPDCGVWELDLHNWTHSRLICAAGLRAICDEADAPSGWTARYRPLGDRIIADTAAASLHSTGRWQRAPDDDRVDASLLLAEIRGAVAAEDPRSVATRRAVVEELSQDDCIYRFRHQGLGLEEAEGAFLVCNFWMSLACFGSGDTLEGVRWFERARTSAGSPGLLSEELDVQQRQLRGNLPQAFVHGLLVEAAAAQGPR